MTYRRSGKSGLALPAISLGLWHNFGDIDSFDVARSVVIRAFDLGITHFDLANNYGPPPGSAERNFGKILRRDFASRRDELVISTKAGYKMWEGPYGDGGSRKYLVASLDQSLRRMGIDYVDIFYHHRPDPSVPIEETMGALEHIVRSGKALYAGISSYDADQTRSAAGTLNRLGVPCLIHQPKYNMFTRWIEPDLLRVLGEEGIGCIAFSPLAQGILTGRYLHGIPSESRAAKPHGFLNREELSPVRMAMVGRLDAIARDRGQSLAQMALAWVLRHGGMTSALVGASRVEQIEESVGALENLGFSHEELRSIDETLSPPSGNRT